MADEEGLNINIGANPEGVEAGSKRGAAAIGTVTKEAKDMDAAFRRLKSAIDPTFAAQERYNKALADNKRLLDAGRISQQEYAAGALAAKAALDQQVETINRGSAAARAAAAETKRLKSEEIAATAAAAVAARNAAREQANAEKAAARDAAATLREAKAQEKQAIIDAANAAKQAAREKLQAERESSRAGAEAEKAAKREATQAARAAASAAATAAREKKEAEASAAQTAKQAAVEAQKLAVAEKQAAAAAEELRASIDPSYAAQQRFNQTMAKATTLLQQNKISQAEWIAIQKQAKAQMDLNVRSLGRMNSTYVQLGYQSQDVVASLASGISPLVILAQQGGQTAAALSMMGGTVGRVAAFFAGPWGAAIIGATLLLGLFMSQNDKAKDKTLDLKDAEERRLMTIKQLTDALHAFNKEQVDANNNIQESQRLNNVVAIESARQAADYVKQVETKIQNLKKLRAAVALQGGGPASYAGVDFVLQKLDKDLKSATEAAKDATSAITETEIPQIMAKAEAATNGATKAQQDFYAEQTRLYDIYKKSNRTISDRVALEKGLIAAINARTAAEKAWQESQRAGRGGIEETAQYMMPVRGPITSGFGKRETFKTANGAMASTQHAGIDIGAPTGTAVQAPQVGVVESVGYSPSLGKYVILSHGAGVTTRFGHLSEIGVTKGEEVTQGQRIGAVGSTGNATGPHLHYEVRVNGKAVDPTKGVFAIDRLEAEADSFKLLDKARKEALDNYVEGISYQQALAGEDARTVLDLQDQKIAAIRAFYGADAKETEQAERERVIMERRLQAQILDEQKKGIQARLQADEQAENARDQIQSIKSGAQEDVTQFAAGAGLINQKQELIRKKELLQEEYLEQAAHEERMYQLKFNAMREQLALENLPLKQKNELNKELEDLEAAHLARVEVMQAQHARDVNQINLQTASISLNRWKEVADTMKSSFTSSLQGLWTKSITVTDALYNMADSLVFKFFDMGAQILEDWILHQLGFKTVTAASETANTAIVVASQTAQTGAVAAGTAARVATTATGAVAEKGITIGSALVSIGASAAKAAAGAYSALAGIPIIGPVIAPLAAVGALAAVLAFGKSLFSSEDGLGEVPAGGATIKAHAKETVLPAWIAEPMRQLFVNKSSSGFIGRAAVAGSEIRNQTTNNGGGVNFNYAPVTPVRQTTWEQLQSKHASDMRRWIGNQIRNGAIKV